jgi:hypothetical protein
VTTAGTTVAVIRGVVDVVGAASTALGDNIVATAPTHFGAVVVAAGPGAGGCGYCGSCHGCEQREFEFAGHGYSPDVSSQSVRETDPCKTQERPGYSAGLQNNSPTDDFSQDSSE